MKPFTCETCAHRAGLYCTILAPVVVVRKAETEQGNVGQAVTVYTPQSLFPQVDEKDSCGQWTSKEALRAKRLAQLPSYTEAADE